MALDSPQIPSMPTFYPATTKQAAGIVAGIVTNITTTFFSDKIMVTITQEGRLAHWIHVPLDAPSPSFADQYLPSSSDDDALLPMAHLSPKTLLGGSTSERETIAQLYATQIASVIVTRNPEEKRTVVLGFGLSNGKANREDFYDTIDLVTKCL